MSFPLGSLVICLIGIAAVEKLRAELGASMAKMSGYEADPNEVRTEKEGLQVNNLDDARAKLKLFAGVLMLKTADGKVRESWGVLQTAVRRMFYNFQLAKTEDVANSGDASMLSAVGSRDKDHALTIVLNAAKRWMLQVIV